jgi:hypothetical protein
MRYMYIFISYLIGKECRGYKRDRGGTRGAAVQGENTGSVKRQIPMHRYY